MKFIKEVPHVSAAYFPPSNDDVPNIKVAWGAKVSDEFLERVAEICDSMGWEVDQMSDLMACMAFESGRTFDPAKRNMAGSGATGLIQFMPATARDLGTTTGALAKLSAVEQLDYVQAYFTKYGWHRHIRTLPDMYMAILMPKYIKAPLSAVLFNDGTVAYRQNAGLDANNDGKITKEEAAAKVQAVKMEGLADDKARYYFL